MTLPSLFLSHGAPTLPLNDTPAREFLSKLGGNLPRPKAILVVSAHWEAERPAVSAVAWNETIHDFCGFPRALYDLRYPAPGSPQLAHEIATRLRSAGIDCDVDNKRGLDHGAWVPLSLIYPGADIPVVELSVQPQFGPEHHLRIGRALAPLRDQEVLIIGSGSFTHDLSEFRGHQLNEASPAWVNQFADWFDAALTEGRTDDLVHYADRAPYARKNHPTEEHLLPLFVALGAGGNVTLPRRLHTSSTYSVLRMDVYAFGDRSQEPQELAPLGAR
jgi:4,5-DOPA dioxygenase extradiol